MKPKQFPAVFLFAATLCGASLFAQSNDNFANRMVVTGPTFTTTTVSSDSATTEIGEPLAHRYHTVWYSWTAPSDLRVTLNRGGSTGSDISMFVYIGNTLGTLCPVLSTSNQTLSWVAVRGVTYQIAVDRYYSSNTGTISLNLTSSAFGSGGTVVGPDLPTTSSPSNDNFSNRKVLSGLPITLIAVNGGATRESAEPSNGNRTLWYSYTAPADQWLDISIESYISDYSINVYQGDSYGVMQLIPTSSNPLSVLMQKNATYHISVANYYNVAENIIQLALSTRAYNTSGTVIGPDSPMANAPTNDNFGSRKTLSGAKLSVFGFNTQATRESFEPAGTGNRTLWYSWGTNQAGNVTVTIGRVGLGTQNLTVYSGIEISSLSPVALTRVAGTNSNYTFYADANKVYSIALGAYYNEGGLVSFDLAGPGAGASAGGETPTVATRLINIATRAIVATQGSLNPGFVIGGNTKKTVLIRGVGPGLAALGVPGTMSDPILTVYSGTNIIATNDNWSDTAANATALSAAFASVGAFALPANSKDAAVLLTLDPGAYTVLLKGVGGVGGDVIAEVYDVP